VDRSNNKPFRRAHIRIREALRYYSYFARFAYAFLCMFLFCFASLLHNCFSNKQQRRVKVMVFFSVIEPGEEPIFHRMELCSNDIELDTIFFKIFDIWYCPSFIVSQLTISRLED
jgi:hypothetical protein